MFCQNFPVNIFGIRSSYFELAIFEKKYNFRNKKIKVRKAYFIITLYIKMMNAILKVIG